MEVDVSLIEVILIQHQENKGCADGFRIGISACLCRRNRIILAAADVLRRVVFIVFIVSLEIRGQILTELALHIRFCAVFKQHAKAGVPYRIADIHTESSLGVTVEAAFIIGRDR